MKRRILCIISAAILAAFSCSCGKEEMVCGDPPPLTEDGLINDKLLGDGEEKPYEEAFETDWLEMCLSDYDDEDSPFYVEGAKAEDMHIGTPYKMIYVDKARNTAVNNTWLYPVVYEGKYVGHVHWNCHDKDNDRSFGCTGYIMPYSEERFQKGQKLAIFQMVETGDVFIIYDDNSIYQVSGVQKKNTDELGITFNDVNKGINVISQESLDKVVYTWQSEEKDTSGETLGFAINTAQMTDEEKDARIGSTEILDYNELIGTEGFELSADEFFQKTGTINDGGEVPESVSFTAPFMAALLRDGEITAPLNIYYYGGVVDGTLKGFVNADCRKGTPTAADYFAAPMFAQQFEKALAKGRFAVVDNFDNLGFIAVFEDGSTMRLGAEPNADCGGITFEQADKGYNVVDSNFKENIIYTMDNPGEYVENNAK